MHDPSESTVDDAFGRLGGGSARASSFHQLFEHGELWWRPGHAAQLLVVREPQLGETKNLRQVRSGKKPISLWLGPPLGNLEYLDGLPSQAFDGGVIVGEPSRGSAAVLNPLAKEFLKFLETSPRPAPWPLRTPIYLNEDGTGGTIFYSGGVMVKPNSTRDGCLAPTMRWRSPGGVDQTPLNLVRTFSSHNTYNIGERPAYLPLQTVLRMGVRSLELDCHPEDHWRVYHWQLDQGTSCDSLGMCLDALVEGLGSGQDTTSAVTLWLQLDHFSTSAGGGPVALDRLLTAHLGPRLFRPNDLREWAGRRRTLNPSSSLADVIEKCGWPSMGELNGRVMVVLHGGADLEAYLRSGGASESGPAAFVSVDGDNVPEGAVTCIRDRIFLNMPMQEPASKWVRVTYAAWAAGRITRLYLVDQTAWRPAASLFVNHIATDMIPGPSGAWEPLYVGQSRLQEAMVDADTVRIFDTADSRVGQRGLSMTGHAVRMGVLESMPMHRLGPGPSSQQ